MFDKRQHNFLAEVVDKFQNITCKQVAGSLPQCSGGEGSISPLIQNPKMV